MDKWVFTIYNENGPVVVSDSLCTLLRLRDENNSKGPIKALVPDQYNKCVYFNCCDQLRIVFYYLSIYPNLTEEEKKRRAKEIIDTLTQAKNSKVLPIIDVSYINYDKFTWYLRSIYDYYSGMDVDIGVCYKDNSSDYNPEYSALISYRAKYGVSLVQYTTVRIDTGMLSESYNSLDDAFNLTLDRILKNKKYTFKIEAKIVQS